MQWCDATRTQAVPCSGIGGPSTRLHSIRSSKLHCINWLSTSPRWGVNTSTSKIPLDDTRPVEDLARTSPDTTHVYQRALAIPRSVSRRTPSNIAPRMTWQHLRGLCAESTCYISQICTGKVSRHRRIQTVDQHLRIPIPMPLPLF